MKKKLFSSVLSLVLVLSFSLSAISQNSFAMDAASDNSGTPFVERKNEIAESKETVENTLPEKEDALSQNAENHNPVDKNDSANSDSVSNDVKTENPEATIAAPDTNPVSMNASQAAEFVSKPTETLANAIEDAVQSVTFVNNTKEKTNEVVTDGKTGRVYMKVDLNLAGKNVKEGDYIYVKYPADFILKPIQEVITDGNDATVQLADLILEPEKDGGGAAKIVFRKIAEERENIVGAIAFEATIKAQADGTKKAFDLEVASSDPTKQTIQTNEVQFSTRIGKFSYISEEALYKNGFSDQQELKMNYHLRINRMQRELGNVTIEDNILASGRIVHFLPETFRLTKVKYGDKELGDGKGVMREVLMDIPLVEGDNLLFNDTYTSFKLHIDNVGSDSYYLEYRTNHYNDGTSVQNEAILYSDGERIQPYKSVEYRLADTGEVVGKPEYFNNRYMGHVRGRAAVAVKNASLKSDIKEKLLIQKVDKENNRLLKGASFKVYVDAKATKEALSNTFTTDENGIVVVSGLTTRTRYWVKEVQAPKGYKLSDEIKAVVVSDKGTVITFANEAEKIQISVSKTWVGGNPQEHKTTLRLLENRKIAKDKWGKTFDKEVQGEATITWENLPTVDKSGNDIEYSVVEINKPEHYIEKIEKVAEGEFKVTNTYQKPKEEPKPTNQPPVQNPNPSQTTPQNPPQTTPQSAGSSGGSSIHTPFNPIRPSVAFDIEDGRTPLSGTRSSDNKTLSESKEESDIEDGRTPLSGRDRKNATKVAGASKGVPKIHSSAVPKTGINIYEPWIVFGASTLCILALACLHIVKKK
ncbi:MAG: SpaA isopeptide-forming pilin-related protein [Peptostreptococcaceae bacterium]|nr:SpaA isopeptide-forming pilin-related protein [Peptostreptococcaceae bacterium]